MRVLDLFSGREGFSQAFKNRGHEVLTVEIQEKFKPDICADVMTLGPEDLPGPWDIVLASPPCNAFSRAAISYYWDGYFIPRRKETINFIALAHYTKWLIRALQPRYYIIENPMGQLRHKLLFGKPKATISMCQYEDRRKIKPMKPTDLWGKLPPFPLRHCKNDSPYCNHERAKRGAKTGIQSMSNSEERAIIPYGLSLEICKAVEGAIPKESILNYGVTAPY